MEKARYLRLETDFDGLAKLSEQEIREGWHYCPEWDYMLVGPGMAEAEACICGVIKNV